MFDNTSKLDVIGDVHGNAAGLRGDEIARAFDTWEHASVSAAEP